LADKAIDLFNQIENPNEIILILLFNACAQLKTDLALNLVKKVSSQMSQSFYSNEILVNSLIDALIKCGDCSSAEIYFENTKKNVITYGNLMNGFNKEKNPEKTLNLFSQMVINHVEPTPITYLCLINALSQLGFSSLSQSFIDKMPKSFLSNLRIQTALINMWVSSLSIFIDFISRIF
jgi:pentatricopeptide repeat protein